MKQMGQCTSLLSSMVEIQDGSLCEGGGVQRTVDSNGPPVPVPCRLTKRSVLAAALGALRIGIRCVTHNHLAMDVHEGVLDAHKLECLQTEALIFRFWSWVVEHCSVFRTPKRNDLRATLLSSG